MIDAWPEHVRGSGFIKAMVPRAVPGIRQPLPQTGTIVLATFCAGLRILRFGAGGTKICVGCKIYGWRVSHRGTLRDPRHMLKGFVGSSREMVVSQDKGTPI